MNLPSRAKEITIALYEKHKPPSHDEEARRTLARAIAEQCRFELGEAWGWKKASNGRPPAKDAIAMKQPDGRLFGWDLFMGSTGKPHAEPLFFDISDQVFIEVPPFDHLGVTAPAPSPPAPQPPDDALSTVAERLAALEQLVKTQEYAATVEGDVPLPAIFGGARKFHGTVVLKPKR